MKIGMAIYTALYSYENVLLYESSNEGLNRIIVYSATEIVDYIIRERKTDVFLNVVKYNGKKVSAYILENGFKVFAVFDYSEDEKKEMQIISNAFRESVLKGEFNRFEF